MGFLWFGKKETSKPAPDGLVRLENYCGMYEPVEAIIKMYNGNHPIQQTVMRSLIPKFTATIANASSLS